MATVMLQIADADMWTIENAKEHFGDDLPLVIIDFLRHKVEPVPVPIGTISRITADVRNSSSGRTIQKSFYGRWLIGKSEDLHAEQDADSAIQMGWPLTYCLAQTKKGALVVYTVDPETEADRWVSNRAGNLAYGSPRPALPYLNPSRFNAIAAKALWASTQGN
jgi:hypothetical protein